MSALAFSGQARNGLNDQTALEIRAVDLVASNSPRRNYVRLTILRDAQYLGDPRLGGEASRFSPAWITSWDRNRWRWSLVRREILS